MLLNKETKNKPKQKQKIQLNNSVLKMCLNFHSFLTARVSSGH